MKMKRILSMLAATAVMASSVAVMGVSADETTTGGGTDTTRTYSVDEAVVDVDLLPGIDADWKQISADDEKLTTSDVTYLSDPAIPTVEITETDSGAIRFKMSTEVNKELRTWYDAQCDLNLENVFINGKYLYYDFRAVGQWNINLYLSSEGNAQENAIKLGCYIMANKYDDSTVLYTQGAQGDAKKHTYGYDEDGTAGTYRGRLDLQAAIEDAIKGGAVEESKLPANLLKDGGYVDLYRVGFWVVGATSSNLTVNSFFLGHDPSDPTVTEPEITSAQTTAATQADGANATTGNGSNTTDSSDSTMTIVIVVVVVVVVAAAIIVGVVISKKKKK